MIIRVEKRDNPFVMIDKTPINDRKLSWKAKGMLSYLLSKPDNWKPSIEEMSKAATDKTDSVKTGLQELEKAGYLVRRRLRNDKGKIIGWERIVYEKPQVENPLMAQPLMEYPQVEKPQVAEPHVGKHPPNNIDLNNNDFNNKKDNAPDGASVILPTAGNEEISGAQCDEGQPGSIGNGEEYSQSFLTFWNCYPRKKEKLKAWRAWKTRLKECKPHDMIGAAQKYALECKGSDQKFIKLAATFLGPDKPFKEYLGREVDGENRQFAGEVSSENSSNGRYEKFFN